MQQEAATGAEALEVWIDQDLCTGDCIHVRRVLDSVEVYGPDAG